MGRACHSRARWGRRGFRAHPERRGPPAVHPPGVTRVHRHQAPPGPAGIPAALKPQSLQSLPEEAQPFLGHEHAACTRYPAWAHRRDAVQIEWMPAGCTLPITQVALRIAEFDRLVAAALCGQERPSATRPRWHLDAAAEPATREPVARGSTCCSFFTSPSSPLPVRSGSRSRYRPKTSMPRRTPGRSAARPGGPAGEGATVGRSPVGSLMSAPPACGSGGRNYRTVVVSASPSAPSPAVLSSPSPVRSSTAARSTARRNALWPSLRPPGQQRHAAALRGIDRWALPQLGRVQP